MIRYFRQQIDSIFWSHVVRALLDDWTKAKRYEPFFVTVFKESSFEVHGRLKQEVNSQDMLLRYLQERFTYFKSVVQDDALISSVEGEVLALKQHIQKSSCLPQTTREFGLDRIGMQKEVQIQVEQERETEVALENDIDLEMQRYQTNLANHAINTQPRMSLKAFKGYIDDVKKVKPKSVIALQDQLAKYRYGTRFQREYYQKIFYEPIFGTQEYFFPYNGDILPVFHPQHRPPNHILVVRTMFGVRFLLLSTFQAGFARTHLELGYAKGEFQDVWLAQPDGSLLIDGLKPFPREDAMCMQGLFEIQILSGDVHRLIRKEGAFKNWMALGDGSCKKRFLRMHVAGDSAKRKTLERFFKICEESSDNGIQGEQDALKWIPKTPVCAKVALPDQVARLHEHFVRFLGIDSQSQDRLMQKACEIIALDPRVPSDPERFTQMQFFRLAPWQIPHLVPEQMQWLPLEKVKHLATKEQMYRDHNGTPKYYLNEEQVKRLTKEQAHLIPYIDPKYYSLLCLPEHIRQVPLCHVGRVNRACFDFLTDEQIHNIPKGIDLTNAFSDPSKYGCLHGNLFSNIPRDHVKHATVRQIAEIADPEIIATLQEFASGAMLQKWSNWVSSKMIPHLSEPCIKHLYSPQLPFVTPSQMEHLTKEQVKCLPGDMTKDLPGVQVQYLDGAQLPYLVKSQLSYVTQSQMEHLTKEQVKCLPGDMIKDLPGVQVQYLKDVQMRYLEKSQVSYVVQSQLKHLTTKGQIREVSFWRVQHLTRDQLRKRSWSQFVLYTLAVLALGVASSIVACVAFLSLVPLILRFARPDLGKKVIAKIQANPKRLYRYFKVYLAA